MVGFSGVGTHPIIPMGMHSANRHQAGNLCWVLC